MDIKALLKMLASPLVLAAAGGYVGRQYGNKLSINNKTVAMGVGAGAGYLAGQLLQRFLVTTPVPPTPAELQAAQAQGDYVDLFDTGRPQMVQPRVQMLAAPSPANVHVGEGAYGSTSYNTEDTEAAMGEAEAILYDKSNGN